ncbi:hypothetical protein PTI98_006020 [Pleurotus ostreatus]|uniref:Uncharacterized protein n=1 Tax=Pleurotus cornucopiae TaxID=5321 RepID=A0ACB7IQQ8_PLECO|nr:hypothetical protein CCMSSC00406_0004003 [Pleurotus cornucopiae]KAJ8696131.1 hypothetical protein PTI98_006020 [Pleurotus ostreatus]
MVIPPPFVPHRAPTSLRHRTGVHTVADVFCLGCDDRIGWYYHKASDYSQKYKEGKYLLEREKLIKENAWTLDEQEDGMQLA